jgi:hypothetical protein
MAEKQVEGSRVWRLRQWHEHMSIPSGIRKDKNVTASALFGVAAIQIIIGALGLFLYSAEMGLIDKVIALSGIIYILLGFAARRGRVAAALIGAGIYAGFLALQAFRSMDLLMTGLIFKIPVVILLVVAVVFALKRPPVSR